MWLVVSKRRRLRRFFGLRGGGITLYTSTLHVLQFGSTGWDGAPRSFNSRATPSAEANVIADFQRAFSTFAAQSLATSGPLRHLRVVDIECSAEPSPSTMEEVVRGRTFLTVGSPAYNTASALVEQEFNPIGRFAPTMVEIVLPDGYPESDELCGFVVRCEHPRSGQVAFYAAGPSEAGTVAAARYLLENWTDLAKRRRDQSVFCVLIRATTSDGRSYEVLA